MISKEEFNDLYYVIKNPTTIQQKMADALKVSLGEIREIIDVKFCDKYYKATSEYDACLSAMYGDYMKLSSKSAQVFGHAPKSLDFEREYNDIVNGKKRNYMNYESL